MNDDKTKAVLFDLDGTLLDTIDDITLQLGRALVAFGRGAPTSEQVRGWVGDGAPMLVARALGLPLETPLVREVLDRYKHEAESDPMPATRVMPGARELLDALHARGIVSVVCTNKLAGVAQPVIAAIFGDRIRGVIGAGDTAKLKPARDPVDAALAMAAARAAEAWMVGDGPQDVAAAHAAGVRAIALKGYGNWERVLAEVPERVVSGLDEVLGIVTSA